MSIGWADQATVRRDPDDTSGWQASFRDAIRCPHQLLRALQLEGQVELAETHEFPVFVPREFLARMRPGDPNDPLLRQVLPGSAEEAQHPGFSADPLREAETQPIPGVIRKYRSQALLVLTGVCAVHCRYCFRRDFPYQATQIRRDRIQDVVDEVDSDSRIQEVIYSGGDPLMWGDDLLATITASLAQVSHVRALRIHTRLPVVIPSRIEDATLAWMTLPGLPTQLVIHANHARELDDDVAEAITRVKRAGINVLNQAVLLKGVNDSLEALRDLSWRLIEIGVLPYYLHQLDRVRGAAHFEVPVARGMSLLARLREELPGYAVPRYALEEPGQPAKTILV